VGGNNAPLGERKNSQKEERAWVKKSKDVLDRSNDRRQKMEKGENLNGEKRGAVKEKKRSTGCRQVMWAGKGKLIVSRRSTLLSRRTWARL